MFFSANTAEKQRKIMKRNIIVFIAIIAAIELAVAYFLENNGEFGKLVGNVTETVQTEQTDDTVDEEKPFRLYIDILKSENKQEAETSIAIAERVKKELGAKGISARVGSAVLQYRERAIQAAEFDAAITLGADGGIDYNGDENLETGINIYTYPEAQQEQNSQALAKSIMDEITFDTEGVYAKREVRGVGKSGAYEFLRYCSIPAAVVIYGYYNNETAVMNDENYLTRIAKCVAEGVEKYAAAQ